MLRCTAIYGYVLRVDILGRARPGLASVVMCTVEPLYKDTAGTKLAVLYRMKSLYEETAGAKLTVLYREVSLIQM